MRKSHHTLGISQLASGGAVVAVTPAGNFDLRRIPQVN